MFSTNQESQASTGCSSKYSIKSTRKTNFKKLQSRPERKTSLDKCISKISADYKNDEIRTIQDLTQEIFHKI